MGNSTEEPIKSRAALFEQVLRCLDREENLIHYRMSWGLQWNFAWLAALGAVLFAEQNSLFPMDDKLATTIKYFIVFLISISGVIVSVVSFIGIQAAHSQVKFLIDQLEKRLQIHHPDDWVSSEFIRPYGQRDSVHPIARKVSAFFPLAFAFLWALIVVYSFFQIFTFKLAT
ncbi:hypothetical protein D3C81_428410 [compost metagenome]